MREKKNNETNKIVQNNDKRTSFQVQWAYSILTCWQEIYVSWK